MSSKRFLSSFRTYRPAQKPDLQILHIQNQHTDMWAAASTDITQALSASIRRQRTYIQTYTAIHPEFLYALTPLKADANAPAIIQRMCQAGQSTGVGPMAAVAGAIAQACAEELQHLCPEILLENGGDTYLRSKKKRRIGLLSLPEEELMLAIPVNAEEFPCSFCASSATIGHSLSFGNADLVVVRARDAALADAAATALANQLTTPTDLERVLKQGERWANIGIDGVFTQCQGQYGFWGAMQFEIL